MTPKVKENKEFAKWLQDWTAVTQQNRTSVDHTPPEKTARADRQKHPDGAHLPGPNQRAASGEKVI